ncbi:divalent-cation tolerance protein CutA [Caenispirillum bisanense]|uniref:divalent-cation tolerance protein CutA n=1 Tax=Caenispirillum bisanense TaxID=414052 RepID=UPI0031D43791
MSSPVILYMTAASHDEATRIGRVLVEERLAACVNVLAPMTSLYWWNDAVQQEQEVPFLAKTRQDLAEAVIARVKALHSYDCPCIVVLPVTGGNPAFLQWIDEQTAKPSPPKD